MMDIFDMAMLTAVLSAAVRIATPIAFAALGGVVAERSGIYNVGLEGMMLSGALGSAAGAAFSGSPLVGLIAGVACGSLAAVLLSVLVVTFRVNQLVAGIAVNLLCAGLTAFLAREIFDGGRSDLVAGFSRIDIPVLSSIPILGPALFGQDPLVYLLFGLIGALLWLFYGTHVGLKLRASGESPRAADSAGVNVFALRHTAIAASGALAGLGGCHLVLCQVFVFTEGMSAGRGFIALAAIILGRWHPAWATLAALFFGLCDAVQFRLQFANPEVPYQVFLILPFAAAILALVGIVGSVNPPEAIGRQYDRESR